MLTTYSYRELIYESEAQNVKEEASSKFDEFIKEAEEIDAGKKYTIDESLIQFDKINRS